MNTIDDIIAIVTAQQLLNNCVSETSQMTTVLQQYITPTTILSRINSVSDKLLKLHVFHITYNASSDEFLFHMNVFGKVKGDWVWESEQTTVKWIHTIGTEYVLMYNSNTVDAGTAFHKVLPVILKMS